jgi:chlorobactene glucosyltransferase
MLGWAFLVLTSLSALIWFAINIHWWLQEPITPRLEPAEPKSEGESNSYSQVQGSWPRVAIICPGRNEAEHIGSTLDEICNQDYPGHFEVFFVDDDSDDDTPKITAQLTERHSHFHMIRNQQNPPTGWVGKCWAVHCGYESLLKQEASQAQNSNPQADDFNVTKFELLCFTDADVHWHPACLRMAVGAMRDEQADLVSILLGLEFSSVREKLLMSTLMLGLLLFLSPRQSRNPKRRDTLTAGAFILTKRTFYDQIGGHEAVKACMVDDLMLGRALKAAGAKPWIAFAPHLQYCRMYKDWPDLWEGLTKNAYAGFEYRLWAAGLVLSASLIANILPPIYLVAGLTWAYRGGGTMALIASTLAALTLVLQGAVMNSVRRYLELGVHYIGAIPAGAAIYFPVIVASIWRYYRGGNRWKGRSFGPVNMQDSQAKS